HRTMRLQRVAQVAMERRPQPRPESVRQSGAGQVLTAQPRHRGGGKRRVQLKLGEGIAGRELGQGKADQHRSQDAGEREQKAPPSPVPRLARRSAHAPSSILALVGMVLGLALAGPAQSHPKDELIVPLNSEPQTFNPAFATDSASQLLASLTMADLMHINPRTLAVEPALAQSVEHRSPRQWIVHLRPNVRFSDGVPMSAEDVAFSFRVYTDAKLSPPQRDLLTSNGKTVECKVLDATSVELDLPAPMAVGDRLFDSLWILPRHLLLSAFQGGHLDQAWGLGTAAVSMAGLGPFRIESYQPGREVALTRNPQYWRRDAAGTPLPYLARLRLPIVADPNLRLTLFARGQVDGLDAISSGEFAHLEGNACCRLLDAGAGLNAETMVLNQAPADAAAPAAIPRAWFRMVAFRRAISLAIDRANLVTNVFGGHAAPLATLTSPSNKAWAESAFASMQDLSGARKQLQQAGVSWKGGLLLAPGGRPVAFSLIVPASNAARSQIAVYLQEDLRKLGMTVQVVPLEFTSYVDRLQRRDDFEAALVGIQIPDADPNVEGYL